MAVGRARTADLPSYSLPSFLLQWLPLEDVKSGRLHVKLECLPPIPSATELEQVMEAFRRENAMWDWLEVGGGKGSSSFLKRLNFKGNNKSNVVPTIYGPFTDFLLWENKPA